MKYEPIRELSTDEVALALQSGDAEQITAALWSQALFGEDQSEVELQLIQHANHDALWVRNAVVLGIGYLGRRLGSVSGRAVAVVREALRDPQLHGVALDALSDLGLNDDE